MAHEEECFESVPLHVAVVTYLNYALWYVVWVVHDFIKQTFLGDKIVSDKPGYVPLMNSFECLYRRNVMRQAGDLFDTPICSTPGAKFTIKNRVFTDDRKIVCNGSTSECLNLGSYNYLGFAQATGPCADAAERVTRENGVGIASTRHEIGNTTVLKELEECVARFIGAEDSISFGMGFATNALNLPTLLGKGCLVLSDELNHASIVLGLRLSGAVIRVFRHGDTAHLEQRLREAIVDGQPRINRPWRKILIVVEGVYSMEGSIVRLPEIIALKKKYNAYLYLDEAHSIGAMGPRGRGIVDYYGCDPKDVDILMGTFTKSFGSAGGYIAGSKNLINYIRTTSHAACYATSMSAPVAQQIISSMKIIMGEDGTDEGKRRLETLSWNSKYFRTKLRQAGFIVYGHDDSPVVPLLIYMPAKVIYFVREMKRRGFATVGVGFPATKISESRIRFCISSAHTKEMLDQVIEAVYDVGNILCLHYSRLPPPKGEVTYGPPTKQNGHVH